MRANEVFAGALRRLARRSPRLFAVAVMLAFGSALAMALSAAPLALSLDPSWSLFVDNALIFEPFAIVGALPALALFYRRPRDSAAGILGGALCVLVAIVIIAAYDASRVAPTCIVPLCDVPVTFLDRLTSEALTVVVTSLFLLLSPWIVGGLGGYTIWFYARARPNDP